jgi:hypothetical protein
MMLANFSRSSSASSSAALIVVLMLVAPVVVVATPVGLCNHHCTDAIIIASISLLVIMQASAGPELLG